MHESPTGFFHLDHPADGVVAPAGPVVFRGWASGRNGVPFVDLRISHEGKHHPAVHGFPRADLPAFFGLRDAFLPGGFEAVLSLPAGEHTLAFEGLDISGRWLPVGTVQLAVAGEMPPAAAPAASIIQPHEFARALQFTLRRATTVAVTEASAELAARLPRPMVLRYPHAPFHGHLHEPALLDRVLFGRLCLSGWLFHETAAIRSVAATVDLQTWQDLRLGGEIPYVTAQFPQFAAARDGAISGWIDVPAQLPSPLCVRVYAELADGTWHLCHVQRAHVEDQEQEKIPFAPVGAIGFAQTCLKLRRACRQQGFALPANGPLLKGIRGVYQEYRAQAQPRRAPPATPPATPAPARPLRHVTLITHNLALEGAPLFLLELAGHLAASGVRLQVISAQDGPLAAAYREMGTDLRLVETKELGAARSESELTAALDRLGAALSFDHTDLVIANTLSAYWGVHLARRAGRPSLFYIHESTTPAAFFLGHLAPATLPVIESVFRLATHVSFLTGATRAYYLPWLGAANHSVNPGWIAVRRIDDYLAAHPRDALRRQLDVPAGTKLVVNVGTVCNRKGQHIFVRAVDLFARRSPALAAQCRFLLVGGHDTLFDHDLARLLERLNRADVRVIPATAEPLVYYGAADLFACSSYEESFPRVIMEAMACGAPVLSTGVHGIRDMLTSGRDGWLIPAGDSHAMASGLEHMLTNPNRARDYAARARARVVEAFDARTLLPRHAALAASVSALSSR